MLPNFIDKTKLPHKPGIYIYKDATDQIIYVGKAIDLYHRVSSYFSGRVDSLKTATLVTKIRSIETIIVESELEALILEANLIKKYLPPFNIRLTDDKDYLYIIITREQFPRILSGRKAETNKVFAKRYFGPFPSSRIVRETLKLLRRVFPWCTNPPGPRNKHNRPCFYYHIKLCPGACIGKISSKDYNKIIDSFSKFMGGMKSELLSELIVEMNTASKSLQFEQAIKMKKMIEGIDYLTQINRVKNYLENPNFLQDQSQKALLELQKVLNLSQLPQRIECYDISNFKGKEATGSMVVLTNGEIDKTQYRRFKIKISGKPDDYAMHQEMMQRRLKHLEWPYPQLFLIDGGRGQVGAVQAVIHSVEQNNVKNIPIYGLAKSREWLYPPNGEIIKLPKRSLALRMLQKIRDESHRFAITYHKKLRQKSFGV